jgi:uncharacterized membrane-anchored protein
MDVISRITTIVVNLEWMRSSRFLNFITTVTNSKSLPIGLHNRLVQCVIGGTAMSQFEIYAHGHKVENAPKTPV